jgi:hypothetical protein
VALAVAPWLGQIAGMAADEPAEKSKLAVVGGVTLSPYIKPENAPDIARVLKGFGPRSPPDIEQIILALDDMAMSIWGARKRKPPMKFEDAKKLLAPLEARIGEVLTALERAAPLHQAIYRARMAAKTTKERRELVALAPAANDVLLAVRILRDPNGYRGAYDQPDGQKYPERALIWEPLFGLMNQFGLRERDFRKHQPLMTTVKALHRVVGIDPPDENAFKATIRDWRKKEAEAGG